MDPQNMIQDQYMQPERSLTEVTSESRNTGITIWDSSAVFHGNNNHEISEPGLPSVMSTATVVPHRCHAQLDASASGVSNGNEIFGKLSRINGAINKMTQEQMKKKLAELKQNTCGVTEVLRKRLKSYYKRQRLAQFNKLPSDDEKMKYDFLVVIDFEATCSETNEDVVHEIIEFPAVLVDTQNQAVCDTFQRFCKPTVNPILTDFCISLTGISQAQVDNAKYFTHVFGEFEEWLTTHNLGTKHTFAVLTDGPWDMSRFLKTQIDLSGITFPHWAKQWINLRKAYTAFYSYGRVNLHQMLRDLGMTFQGRPHCGLDDAHNIAAIAVQLLQDGCILRINEYIRDDDSQPQNQADLKSTLEKSNMHKPSATCLSKSAGYGSPDRETES